jgi:hypothetical protein
MASASHQRSSPSWRHLIRRGRFCCFCAEPAQLPGSGQESLSESAVARLAGRKHHRQSRTEGLRGTLLVNTLMPLSPQP